MAQVLDAYINKSVNIVTADGRIIIGTLRGFDQAINIILDESHERVFSATDGVEQVLLGLYIIRGDNVALIGEIDEELDKNIDYLEFELIRYPRLKHKFCIFLCMIISFFFRQMINQNIFCNC